MNLRTKIASGLLAAGLLTASQGITTLDSAEAATNYSCFRYNAYYINCYVDYNWYEESWWGGSHVDGRKLIYSPQIYMP